MTATSANPLSAKRATNRRSSAPASAPPELHGDAGALLDAVAVACAAYAADDGRLLLANRAFSAEFGAARTVTRHAFESAFDDYAAQRDAEGEREVFDSASGRWYALQWMPSRWRADVPCSIVTATNITERMEALRAHKSRQERLIFTSRFMSVGEMATTLAHELNQPLAALQTAADNAILLVDRGSIGDARGNLTRIGELVRRLGRLTGQLRLFAYKSSSSLEAVSVENAVAEVLKLLAARIKEAGVEVSIDIEPGLSVLADQPRLEQLLCNILANALDAIESVERRSIVVRAAVDEGRVSRGRITISNNGPAIPSDVLARLFEPFVTTKPAGKGLGLGLMISNHIARSFGGELQAQNRVPCGAEFVVMLRLPDPPEASHE